MDPLGDVDGPNRYAYCQNDPVNKYDPLGLFDESKVLKDFKNSHQLLYLVFCKQLNLKIKSTKRGLFESGAEWKDSTLLMDEDWSEKKALAFLVNEAEKKGTQVLAQFKGYLEEHKKRLDTATEYLQALKHLDDEKIKARAEVLHESMFNYGYVTTRRLGLRGEFESWIRIQRNSQRVENLLAGMESFSGFLNKTIKTVNVVGEAYEFRTRFKDLNSPDLRTEMMAPWNGFHHAMGVAEGLVDCLPPGMQKMASMPFDAVQALDPVMNQLGEQQVQLIKMVDREMGELEKAILMPDSWYNKNLMELP